jgi:ribosomal protein S18 acetylase RimI-like enzyme
VTNFDELDNPIWVALTTRHAGIARSTGVARRYASLVSPLAGLKEPTPAAFSDLAGLVGPEEHVGLFTAEPLQVPSDWLTIQTRPIEQMICTGLTRGSLPLLPELGRDDIPEMLALTAATEPGPFLLETIQMGRFFGIRSNDGRLIAMAGERLKLNGFAEISAVCTSPEFRGHGHAGALVSFLVAQTLAEGRVPFLHVKAENGAKSLYEKLGFRVRRTIQLTVISPGDAGIQLATL